MADLKPVLERVARRRWDLTRMGRVVSAFDVDQQALAACIGDLAAYLRFYARKDPDANDALKRWGLDEGSEE